MLSQQTETLPAVKILSIRNQLWAARCLGCPLERYHYPGFRGHAPVIVGRSGQLGHASPPGIGG